MKQLCNSNFKFFEWCKDEGYNLKIFDYIDNTTLDRLYLMKYGLRYSLYDSLGSEQYQAIYMLYQTKWNAYINKYQEILDNIISQSSTTSEKTTYSENNTNTSKQDTTSYDDDTYSPDTKSEDTGIKTYELEKTNISKNNITMNKINLLKYEFLCDIIFTDINKILTINFYNVYL